MKIQTQLCAALTALTILLAGCAPPAEQEAQQSAEDVAKQAEELKTAQDELAKAEAEAAKKQEALDAAQSRAAKAEREARRERESSNAAASAPAAAPAVQVCNDCGTVASINEVKAKGKGSGLGAVAGAVLGGVAGHQFGGGRGKDVATVAGAAAGGFAGHQVERSARSTTYYDIGVRMENGSYQTVKLDSASGLGIGTAVRVVGDSLQLR